MPWLVEGNCVRKKNADGSAGETVKCHDSPEEAKRHARALYANVHEAVAEFSMLIQKANKDENGNMRWRSVNSDIEEDYYGERMSVELFQDFDRHIRNNDPIPAPFCSVICEDDWNGGMPYLSLAHYRTGKGKVNVPGEVQNVYLDGTALKSKGILNDTPLGKAVFKSLKRDLEEKSDNRIRISIGFLDLEHEHVGEGVKSTFTRKSLSDKCRLCKSGTGTKIYKKGHLVHLALTRVPANPRTEIEVERAMTTKLEDAKSIVDDEEVLETLELKSTAEEESPLVIKAEEPEPVVVAESNAEESTVLPTPEPVAPVTEEAREAVAPQVPAVPEPTSLQKSFAALESKIAALKSQGVTGDAALQEIQAEFDAVGNTIKSEFTPAPSPQEVANQNLEATLRSLLSEMLPQALAQTVAPMQAEISELRALSLAGKPATKEEKQIPQPRSLNPNLLQQKAVEALVQKTKMSQFDKLAAQSVGLQVQ